MWIIIWGIVILFSTVSFTLISLQILYKGVGELKEMIRALKERA